MKTSVVALAAAASLSAGIGGAAQGVSGTLHQSAVDDGTPAYVKAVEATAACTDPGSGLQAGQAYFEAGKAGYALPGLADGRYTLCFFIDTDDNIQETMGPSPGDYGAIKPVSVEGETTLDVSESEWMRIP